MIVSWAKFYIVAREVTTRLEVIVHELFKYIFFHVSSIAGVHQFKGYHPSATQTYRLTTGPRAPPPTETVTEEPSMRER